MIYILPAVTECPLYLVVQLWSLFMSQGRQKGFFIDGIAGKVKDLSCGEIIKHLFKYESKSERDLNERQKSSVKGRFPHFARNRFPATPVTLGQRKCIQSINLQGFVVRYQRNFV